MSEKNVQALSDPGIEKAVLAGIYQHGLDAYIDISDIINADSFTVENNKILFKCLEIIIKSENVIDETTILTTATQLGLQDRLFNSKKDIEFLRAILNFPITLENVRPYAKTIAKLELTRLARNKLKKAYDELGYITGSESVDEIVEIPESAIFDLIEEITKDKNDGPVQIAQGGEDLLNDLINDPKEMAGVPTPWPMYNTAIGGGLRRGGVNLIGARPKTCKSVMAKEAALHFAKELKIPALVLDTEMVKDDSYFRSLASISKVPINDIETGKFGEWENIKQKVFTANKILENIPFQYVPVAGKPFEEVLSIIRRWIMKDVGCDEFGRTKDCVVIYDYFKLMSEDALKLMQEYQALGFQISRMSDFCKHLDFACLAFVQLNRQEDISQSDRLRWLCHSYSRVRVKTNEEIVEDGEDMGNRKVDIEDTRFGPGLSGYINMNLIGEIAQITEIAEPEVIDEDLQVNVQETRF